MYGHVWSHAATGNSYIVSYLITFLPFRTSVRIIGATSFAGKNGGREQKAQQHYENACLHKFADV